MDGFQELEKGWEINYKGTPGEFFRGENVPYLACGGSGYSGFHVSKLVGLRVGAFYCMQINKTD